MPNQAFSKPSPRYDIQSEAEALQVGSNQTHGLGWLPEEIPETSRVTPTALAALPTSFDWRQKSGSNWMTSVKNQGSCGSCTAFGSVGAFEAMIRIANNNPSLSIDLSEQHLFSCAGGSCASGMTTSTALNYMRNNGVPDESCLPYTGVDNNCGSTCSNWQSRAYRISSWSWLSTSYSSIQTAILNGPVVAAFNVYEDFWGCLPGHPNCGYSGYTGGIYHHTGGLLVSGHCITIVGYDSSQQYWICKNSWGSSWGENGYFRIGFGQCGIEQSVASISYVVPGYTVTFKTNPTSFVASPGTITFSGSTYSNGQTGSFVSGDYTATANAPTDYSFHHWEYSGSSGSGVYVPNISANPTTVQVRGNGWLKAVFSAKITFYTNPSTVGSISWGSASNPGQTNGKYVWEAGLQPDYTNQISAYANIPSGYMFDHWSYTGSLSLSTTTSSPTIVTVTGPGSIIANFVASFDFSMSNSGGITVNQGGSGSNTISVTLTSGATQSVSLAASGLPSGASALFNPTSGNPTFTSTCIISTSSYAHTPTGAYTITVTGTGGGVTRTTTFTLTVNPQAKPSLIITLTDASFLKGQAATITVTIFNPTSTPLASTLYIEIAGPSGYYYFDFSQVSVAANSFASYSFTWQIPSDAAIGTYQISTGLVPPILTAYDVTYVGVT